MCTASHASSQSGCLLWCVTLVALVSVASTRTFSSGRTLSIAHQASDLPRFVQRQAEVLSQRLVHIRDRKAADICMSALSAFQNMPPFQNYSISDDQQEDSVDRPSLQNREAITLHPTLLRFFVEFFRVGFAVGSQRLCLSLYNNMYRIVHGLSPKCKGANSSSIPEEDAAMENRTNRIPTLSCPSMVGHATILSTLGAQRCLSTFVTQAHALPFSELHRSGICPVLSLHRTILDVLQRTPAYTSRVRNKFSLYAEQYCRHSITHALWSTQTNLGSMATGIIRRLNITAGQSVFDAGCGCGGLSYQLLGRIPSLSVAGMDLVPSAITQAKKWMPHGRFHVGDISNLTIFADGTFDVVTSFGVLPYLELGSYCRALHEMFRILKPSGVVWLARAGLDGCGPGFTKPTVEWVLNECLNDVDVSHKFVGRSFFCSHIFWRKRTSSET